MSRFDRIEQKEIERIAKRLVGGGGGVTDHGALTGLGDNDHPQYSQVGHTHVLADVTDYASQRTDPDSKTLIVEHFFANTLTTGLLGDLGWRFTNGSVSEGAAEAGHPGIIRRTSAATSGNVASMYLGSVVGSGLFRWDQFEQCTFVIKIVSLTNNCTYRFGITTTAGTNPPSIGVYFNLPIVSSAGDWAPVMKNGANANSTINAWAGSTSWVKLKIRKISNTQVGFTVDSNPEVTETLAAPNNIPDSTTMQWFMQIVPGTNNLQSVDNDFFSSIIVS